MKNKILLIIKYPMKKIIYLFPFVFILHFTFNIDNCDGQWVQVTNGINSNQFIRCLNSNGINIFAGTQGNGIFLSTNDGNNWISKGLAGNYVMAVVFSGTNTFAGCLGGGVFLSTNNGTNWTQVNNGLISTDIHTLVFSGANLFAASLGGGGVFLSTNDGSNWTNKGLTGKNIYTLAVSGINIFAGTNGGVYLSTNNGANWTLSNNGLTGQNVYTFAFSGSNIFAGAYGGGVYISANNGANWTAVNNGLTNHDVHALVFSGANLYAGTYAGGVFISTNYGASWIERNQGLASTKQVYALTTTINYIFTGTVDNSVWRYNLIDIGNVSPPNTPTLISPQNYSSGSSTGINFVWGKSVGATRYTLQAATDSLFTGITINDSTLTDTVKTMNGLSLFAKYYWRVKSKNVNGSSSWSNQTRDTIFERKRHDK